MKTIGLLGGMSWESTSHYYSAINQGVKRQLGGLHSAKLVLYSVDFQQIEQLQHQGDWQQCAMLLGDAALSLQAAGAECLVIATNTMHKVAPQIEAQLEIPLLHIADATTLQLQRDGIRKVALLGTRFTMEQDFYKSRVEQQSTIKVMVPNRGDQTLIHDIIYQELCKGIVSDASRQVYLRIIENLADLGAEAVILGCTEIAMLVKQHDTEVPLYDTTQIHAQAAVDFSLEQK
ncbi:aspartate/glutamate racemase family protein [Vibrio sp. WXL103]|uniref:aspartate/glutamate racemase family protein n=1 Tax=Vibrio sp. WXL103 TaxID=3450710 RepID=UPI003EC50562